MLICEIESISVTNFLMEIRAQLRNEIIETRRRFHQLLESVPEEAFDWPSDNPAWTVGQVLYHMSLAPRFVIADVRMITGKAWIYRLIPRIIPKWLFDWINARLTRYGARNLSREFLANEYDKAHQIALHALELVGDDEFKKSVTYPDWDPLLSGQVTIERLFHYVKDHFEVHASEINQQISNHQS